MSQQRQQCINMPTGHLFLHIGVYQAGHHNIQDFFVIQIKRKLKTKTKATTHQGKQPLWGRFVPPSQVPPFAFLLPFRFNSNCPLPLPPQNRFQRVTKNHEKKRNVAKMKVQVMTMNSVQELSKSELSSGIFGPFKVWFGGGGY